MKKVIAKIRAASEKYEKKKKQKQKINARMKRGKKGITQEELEIQRKNMLWLAANNTARKSLNNFRKKIAVLEIEAKSNPGRKTDLEFLKKICEAVEKGNLADIKEFNKSLFNKTTNLAANLSTRNGLDAVKEFNPQTRKKIREKIEIIRNGIHRKDMYSLNAAENADREIDEILGKRKARKFMKYYSKTGRKLFELAKELIKNPYKLFFLSIKK